MRLTGYDLASDREAAARIRAGQEMTVTLYWQATAPLNAELKTFVHLRDEGNGTVAQVDAAPLQGFYPTTAWQPGEILNDTQRLTLPGDLKPGKLSHRCRAVRREDRPASLCAGRGGEAGGQRGGHRDGGGRPLRRVLLQSSAFRRRCGSFYREGSECLSMSAALVIRKLARYAWNDHALICYELIL